MSEERIAELREMIEQSHAVIEALVSLLRQWGVPDWEIGHETALVINRIKKEAVT